jgi:transcriptional regulator with XRE-family HTH domain
MDIDEHKRRLEIAARIREARVNAGLTQETLAKKMLLSRVKINRVEMGHADFSVIELECLANVVKLPITYFFDRSKDELTSRRRYYHRTD